MSDYVTASDGVQLPLDSLAKTYTYNGANDITTITVEYASKTYVQTFTYTDGNLTQVSRWIAQT